MFKRADRLLMLVRSLEERLPSLWRDPVKARHLMARIDRAKAISARATELAFSRRRRGGR